MSVVGEQWVSLQHAAAMLGLSVDTVRRRVKHGELESRKVPTRYGPAWQVHLEGLPHLAPGAAEQEPATTITLELVRLVARLQDRLVEMAERIGYLEAQLHRAGGDHALASGPTPRLDGVVPDLQR